MGDLEKRAIERIRTASRMSLHHYDKPLVCTYSGGKDSDVMLELFRRSGIPFEAHHSLTTADAPVTIYHIRETFRKLELDGIKCSIDKHIQPDGSRVTMWNLIPKKLMPPSRRMRYCCSELKETGCAGRMIATGVRWAESKKREERDTFEGIASNAGKEIRVSDEKMLLTDHDDTRKLFERCQMKAKTVVNPIIDWKDSDVWGFIHSEHIHVNPLYGRGYLRVGCIGCPMAGKIRWKEFRDFPRIKRAYIRSFDEMLQARERKGKTTTWKTGEEVFLWWMEDDNIPGQMSIFEMQGDRGGKWKNEKINKLLGKP